MTTQGESFRCISLVVLCGLRLVGQSATPSPCSTVYENHNQTDYGPLKLHRVKGASVIQVGTQKQPGVSGACFILFTEKNHKLLETANAGADGRFELKNIPLGRYRLVARAEGFCTANIPLEVTNSHRHRETEILVHFQPVGIDTCSYGEAVPMSHRGN